MYSGGIRKAKMNGPASAGGRHTNVRRWRISLQREDQQVRTHSIAPVALPCTDGPMPIPASEHCLWYCILWLSTQPFPFLSAGSLITASYLVLRHCRLCPTFPNQDWQLIFLVSGSNLSCLSSQKLVLHLQKSWTYSGAFLPLLLIM